MTVVPPHRTTLERHLMTLRAVKLIVTTELHTGEVRAGEVLKVLELVADDGYWPVADPSMPGANYFRKTRPYHGGTSQHMQQMCWHGWLRWFRDAYELGAKAPKVAPLDKKYLRLVAEVNGQRPEADDEPDEVSKRCVVCRRPFRSRLWTCGDPTCDALVGVPHEVMARRDGLESEGLSVVFDVDLRSQWRFVLVKTPRGTWTTNALKWETWEQLLDRACG